MRRNGLMFDFRERRRFGRTGLVVVFVLGAAAGFAAAVCADDFMEQSGASMALAKLASLHWDKRAEILVRGGWATMPDRERPNKAAARLCAVKLGEAYTSVRRTVPVVPPPR